MSDLISREEVHKILSLLSTEGGNDAKMLFMDAHEFINELPSADAVSREDYHNLLMATNDIDRALRQYQAKDENPSAEPQGELISKTDAVAIVLMCSRIYNLSEQEKWDKCAKTINSL